MTVRLPAFLRSFGIGSEKEFLIDNLSVLLGSGMDVLASLKAIAAETRSRRLRSLINMMVEDVENGESVWKTIEHTRLFPRQTISIIRIGEESGRLVDNLRLLALQKQKDRMFRAKILGAVAYPAFIVLFGSVVGFWVLFFLLPQLASTFASLNVPLPTITRYLIATGGFTRDHWPVMIPTMLLSGSLLVVVLFILPRTRFLGQFLFLHMPGVGRLLTDAETGRVGYLLGTLLNAGVDLVEAMRSVASSASFSFYAHFYSYVADSLEEGQTFDQAFTGYKKSRRVLSIPMQQLIVSSERSGNVPQAFLSIGELYQFRADMSAKNLTIILEPLLLLLIGVSVLFLALAVILPIYSLMGAIE